MKSLETQLRNKRRQRSEEYERLLMEVRTYEFQLREMLEDVERSSDTIKANHHRRLLLRQVLALFICKFRGTKKEVL